MRHAPKMRLGVSFVGAFTSVMLAWSCGGAPVATSSTRSTAVERSEYEPVPFETSDEPYSVYLGRRRIESLVFLDARRVLVTNELGELFASSDGGGTWTANAATRVRRLTIANGNELWASTGWTSHHGPPGGRVMRSRNGGRTWRIVDLKPEDVEHPAMFARIPENLVNQPGEPPLLVLWSGAVVAPVLEKPFAAWPRLGIAPFRAEPHGPELSAAVDRKGTFYFAGRWEPKVAMSRDRAASWSQFVLPVPDGEPEALACHGDACHALVGQRQTSVHWFRASAGANDWKLEKTFDRALLARELIAAKAVPDVVVDFVVCGFLPSDDGVLFTGFGFDKKYQRDWSATFTLKSDGSLASVTAFEPNAPRAGRDEVCKLVRAPDGTPWAAGNGAYRFENGAWRRMWRYPGRDRPRP
jgi:hypothetical protein